MVPDLFNLLVMVVIVGGSLMLLKVAPIDEAIKKIATILVVCVAIVWALRWLLTHVGG